MEEIRLNHDELIKIFDRWLEKYESSPDEFDQKYEKEGYGQRSAVFFKQLLEEIRNENYGN